MKPIPSLFRRSEDRRFVTAQVTKGCEWVIAGEGVARRQYNGTCVLFDPALDPAEVPLVGELHGWWVRRVVRVGDPFPTGFVPLDVDTAGGRVIGWEPAEHTDVGRLLTRAVSALTDGPQVGTHELIGPRLGTGGRNPEHLDHYALIAHADAEVLAAPRDYEGLRVWLRHQPYEGVIWHHPDGEQMAKAKRRDFRA